MKILNRLLTEQYIKDEIKDYKNSKIKFQNKYKEKVGKDVTEIFSEINKILKPSFNNTLTSKNVVFKRIEGNAFKKEISFYVDLNDKEKVITTSYKENVLDGVIKPLKSATTINIVELDEKIHNNKRLLVFLSFDEIIEEVVNFVNEFKKIDVSIF